MDKIKKIKAQFLKYLSTFDSDCFNDPNEDDVYDTVCEFLDSKRLTEDERDVLEDNLMELYYSKCSN